MCHLGLGNSQTICDQLWYIVILSIWCKRRFFDKWWLGYLTVNIRIHILYLMTNFGFSKMVAPKVSHTFWAAKGTVREEDLGYPKSAGKHQRWSRAFGLLLTTFWCYRHHCRGSGDNRESPGVDWAFLLLNPGTDLGVRPWRTGR